jgi:hypothetical protein
MGYVLRSLSLLFWNGRTSMAAETTQFQFYKICTEKVMFNNAFGKHRGHPPKRQCELAEIGSCNSFIPITEPGIAFVDLFQAV